MELVPEMPEGYDSDEEVKDMLQGAGIVMGGGDPLAEFKREMRHAMKGRGVLVAVKDEGGLRMRGV